MQAVAIEVGRKEARVMYHRYKAHAHFDAKEDAAIRLAYRRLAQGRLIIRAIESVARAGVNEDGLPKLALARADAKEVRFTSRQDGSSVMTTAQRWLRRSNASPSRWIDFPAGTFPVPRRDQVALLPPIPARLRPRASTLSAYHVLWEAEWRRAIPKDPYLLRRIGTGDLWLVVAMWYLTEIERAVLAGRIDA